MSVCVCVCVCVHACVRVRGQLWREEGGSLNLSLGLPFWERATVTQVLSLP